MELPNALPDGDSPRSLEVIHNHEAFPLPTPETTEEDLPTDLKMLPGEGPLHNGITLKGTIVLTNYRLLIADGAHLLRIPIRLIWRVENLDIVRIKLFTKMAKTLILTFPDNSLCIKWLTLLLKACDIPSKIGDLFAFYYSVHLNIDRLEPSNTDVSIPIDQEFKRMEFDKDHWQITDINSEFKVCSTYPKFHIVPRGVSKESLVKIASFRGGNRFPSVVWRSKHSGAVILRCAQPCVGIMLWRCSEDEQLVHCIADSCSLNRGTASFPSANRRLLIVDARHYSAAQLNRIKGGGFEFAEYYDRTEINFMCLPNIHVVRDCFEKLMNLYSVKSDLSWFASLEKSNWLQYLSLLIKSSVDIAIAVHRHGRPVMVHCTDGWDRTPQLTSLSLILLDPYYRTIKGFRVLIEREWLDFGHKFADRCGHGVTSSNNDERSPIFLQWLDSVHQILKQYPAAFEFNEVFLVKLSHHVYSTMFGSFLCNSLKERLTERINDQTCSIWNFLDDSNWHICNYLYDKKYQQVLMPSWQLRDLVIWRAVYVDSLSTPATELDPPTASSVLITSGNGVTPSSTSADTMAATSLNDGLPASCSLRRSHSSTDIPSPLLGEDTELAPGSTVYRESSVPSSVCNTNPHSPGISLSNSKRPIFDISIPSDIDFIYPVEASSSDKHDGEAAVERTTNVETHEDNEFPHSPSHKSTILVGNSASLEALTTSVSSGSLRRPLEFTSSPLCSSTDTLIDVNMAVAGSVAAAANGPVATPVMSEMVIPEDGLLHTTNITCSAPQLETLTKTEETTLSANSDTNGNSLAWRSSALEPRNGHNIYNRPLYIDHSDEDEPSSRSACNVVEGKTTVNGGDLPGQSLGYGTGSDLSTPLSSGPPTPDTQDLQLSWHKDFPLAYNEQLSTSETTTKNSSSSTISREPSLKATVTRSISKFSSHYTSFRSDRQSAHVVFPSTSSVEQSCDDDGLTMTSDPTTHYIHHLILHYESKLTLLHEKLELTERNCKKLHQIHGGPDSRDCEGGGPPSETSYDRHSSVSSDSSSFDTVDNSEDLQPIRWVPDHSAPNCHQCNATFVQFIVRKHHCRSCGGVFCGTCSNYYIPVPSQQFQTPVRVCKKCFTDAVVSSSSPPGQSCAVSQQCHTTSKENCLSQYSGSGVASSKA